MLTHRTRWIILMVVTILVGVQLLSLSATSESAADGWGVATAIPSPTLEPLAETDAPIVLYGGGQRIAFVYDPVFDYGQSGFYLYRSGAGKLTNTLFVQSSASLGNWIAFDFNTPSEANVWLVRTGAGSLLRLSPAGGMGLDGGLALGDCSLDPEPGVLFLDEITDSPVASGGGGKIYVKGNKLVIQFNDGGVTRWKYLDLTGTGVTWVHTTSAP